jgi:hypothetical protein
MDKSNAKPTTHAADTAERAIRDGYDPHLIPAETAARIEREGSLYKHPPTEEREANAPTDDQTNAESIHTTGGYTVDNEGLIDNFPVEPEMYYEVPGDARQVEAENRARRIEEYEEINEDKTGELTEEGDRRGKGQGII